MDTKAILVINGSVRGANGNSGVLVNTAKKLLDKKGVRVNVLTLAEPMPAIQEVSRQVDEADALLLVSGVYWHNYSSLLQRFIEVMTAYENSPAFFAKPVACALSMDSVGGGEVAARLLSVFVNLGCWTPPCSTVILSRVGTEAIAAGSNDEDDPNNDVWRMEDLQVVLNNLVASLSVAPSTWGNWPYVALPVQEGPWPGWGSLDLDTPRFLKGGEQDGQGRE